MKRFSKWIILISSIVIIAFLALEAWRENLSMDWQKYQHKYKEELVYKAKSEKDRLVADEYEIKLRQIVVPQLKTFDRCITCHVAMEDSRMKDMPNPLKSHPGDYLDTHDMNKVGCTSCHDGQGRAVTFRDAHAKGIDEFWEKPLLKKPYTEATCVRCHVNTLHQAPTYNLGKQLFKQKGCFACHSIGDIGGVKGPALSDIGNASFHSKMPTAENRHKLLDKFDQNVNLAYMYEAIVEPDAQPEETIMKKMTMSEAEVEALMVYMKSLSSGRRPMEVGAKKSEDTVAPVAVKALPASSTKVTGGSSKGYLVFSQSCVACHTVGEGDGVGPDLEGVVERRERDWLVRFIKEPSKMIEEKDPIVMELMKKFPTPMVSMGLTDEQIDDVINYLKNPKDISVEASASGEAAKESAEVLQHKATQAEITKGAALFQGKQRFLNKGPSCIACHHIRSSGVLGGGSLAKELTDSHSRLGGVALKALLKNSPFPVMKEAYNARPLESDEIDALIAFLEKASEEEGSQFQDDFGVKMVLYGLGGLVALLGLFCVIWMSRRGRTVNKDVFDRQKNADDDSR